MDTNQLVTIASTRPNDQKTQSLQVKEEEPTTMTTTTTSRSTNSENNENRGPTLSFNEIKECHLQWTNIIKCVETSGLPIIDPKTTLNQISGEAKPGEIIALMGPSGSGKTSLLDVLASRSTYDVGKIYLNETSMTDNPSMMKALKRKIAYIEQKEIFLEHLTVKDQLDYTAKLRLGDDYSEEEQLNEVDKIIRLLRLEKCADTKIRLVSGGERKRVNIGTELLTNPSIIILDEPTSSLDSTSAAALMELLVSLAHDHGKTIITSIHQPSSSVFHAFDKVLFLVDGFMVYHGSPVASLSHCKKMGYECPDGHNLADHWMNLLIEENPSTTEVNEKNAATSTSQIVIDGDNLEANDNNVDSSTTNRPRKKSLIETIASKMPGQIDALDLTKLIKRKKEEYNELKTPKARLISKWDSDTFASKIEDGIKEVEGGNKYLTYTITDIKAKKFNTSWWKQFTILLHRSLKNSSSAFWTPLNLLKSTVLGILTGLLWFQVPHNEAYLSDRDSFIFFSFAYWIFEGASSAIFVFPQERAIIFKERASGSYHLSAYFLSKTISEMPTRLLLPSIFWAIAYWMTGMNNRFDVFLGTLVCTLLGALTGEGYGLLCSTVVMDLQKATTIMIAINLTLMGAGGFYIDNIPAWLEWAKYLSPFKHGYGACQKLIFDSPVRCDDSGILAEYCTEGVEYATREQVFLFLNVEGTVALDIGILLILIVVARGLAFLSLKRQRGAERS